MAVKAFDIAPTNPWKRRALSADKGQRVWKLRVDRPRKAY
jgi:hypothetical protein